MSDGRLLASIVAAGCALAVSPYLARLTLTVPDREDFRWWTGAAPSWTRLLATVLPALLLALLGARAVGWSPLLPAWVALALFTAPLSVIDFKLHRLPNRLVLPAAAAGAGLLVVAAAASADWHPLLRAVEAAVLVFAIFFLIFLAAPFGLGDVKLGGLLAGYLGYLSWGYVLYGVLVGFVLASLACLPLVLARRATMKSAIPLGPALVAGTFLVAGFALVPSYLS